LTIREKIFIYTFDDIPNWQKIYYYFNSIYIITLTTYIRKKFIYIYNCKTVNILRAKNQLYEERNTYIYTITKKNLNILLGDLKFIAVLSKKCHINRINFILNDKQQIYFSSKINCI